jgi:hypothetical protein
MIEEEDELSPKAIADAVENRSRTERAIRRVRQRALVKRMAWMVKGEGRDGRPRVVLPAWQPGLPGNACA